MKDVNDYLLRAIEDAMERVGVLIALREYLPPSRFAFNMTIIIIVIYRPHSL